MLRRLFMRADALRRLCGRTLAPRARRSERGQAAVEFAIILPVLVMLLIGMLSGGMLLLRYYDVAVAAREGARAASLGDLNPEQRAKDVLDNNGLDPNLATITIWPCDANYQCAKVEYPVPLWGGGLFGLGSSVTITNTAAFWDEGP